MTLAELAVNERAVVDHIIESRFGKGLSSRLEAMGFVPDKNVTVIRKALMNGPFAVRVGSTTNVAIRKSEAALVKIRRI